MSWCNLSWFWGLQNKSGAWQSACQYGRAPLCLRFSSLCGYLPNFFRWNYMVKLHWSFNRNHTQFKKNNHPVWEQTSKYACLYLYIVRKASSVPLSNLTSLSEVKPLSGPIYKLPPDCPVRVLLLATEAVSLDSGRTGLSHKVSESQASVCLTGFLEQYKNS